MSKTSQNQSKAVAYTHIREFLVENLYLGGLIKTKHVVRTDMLEDEVIVSVPKGTKVTIVEIEL